MPTLTPRQAETLDVLRAMIARNGYSPTTRELAEEMGVVVSVLHGSLTRLQRAGMVTWDPHRARTLRVVDDGHDVDGVGGRG